MSDLKPCLCGGEAFFYENPINSMIGQLSIVCSKCNISTHRTPWGPQYQPLQNAKASQAMAWNTRPIEDELQSQISLLERKCETLTKELKENKEAFDSFADFKAQEIAVLTHERDEARIYSQFIRSYCKMNYGIDLASPTWEDKTDE